jgi:hypothetical protein
MRHSRWLWLFAALPACGAPGHGDPEAGAAPQGLISDLFVVGDVVVDPATYHWAAPDLLLASSEGAGPRTLDVSVSSAVTPHVSYTGTRTPSRSEISAALGWDVSQTVQLDAETSVLVPLDAYARVDAYPSYQRITWSLIALGQVVVGSGTTYKPIGVFFDTCGCIGPDPCGVGCVNGSSGPGGLPGAAGASGTGGSSASTPSDAGVADAEGG